MIEPRAVAHAIKKRFNLAALPFNLSLANAGFTHEQLLQVQQLFIATFKKTVKVVMFTDTVYTLTDKLNEKI